MSVRLGVLDDCYMLLNVDKLIAWLTYKKTHLGHYFINFEASEGSLPYRWATDAESEVDSGSSLCAERIAGTLKVLLGVCRKYSML